MLIPMRRKVLLVPILIACALGSMPAGAAGFELNGRALGDRIDEVLNDPRYECGGVSACFLFTSCTLKAADAEAFHGAPLDTLTLHYTGERIAAIEAQFAPAHFQGVAEAIAREHGDPLSEVPPAGASGNLVYTWREGRRVLRLERSSVAIGRALLIIAEQRLLAELLEQAEKK
jgi:hypothetical protein